MNKSLSTERLIERLERDNLEEDLKEVVRRAALGDKPAGEFVLSSIDKGSGKKKSKRGPLRKES